MSSGLVYGFARSVHERAERLIEAEIFCNDTLLVDALLSEPACCDWEVAQHFSISHVEHHFDDSLEAVEEFLTRHPEVSVEDWEELPFDEREGLAEARGFIPEPKDICEWWRVSEWMADELIRVFEPVLKNAYGTWWGRTCSGQPIIMDGIIQEVVENASGRLR